MNIDFAKILQNSQSSDLEPRDIFMSLPGKDKKYEYPRDVQSDVWKKWFECRKNKNNIIKMNTGSGKTTVGLLILKSCLNEGVGPAVYVVPDAYLVEIAEEFNCSECAIRKALKKLNITRKKRQLHTRSNAKKK